MSPALYFLVKSRLDYPPALWCVGLVGFETVSALQLDPVIYITGLVES